MRSMAGVDVSRGSARTTVTSHAAANRIVGMSAKPRRMRKRRARKPTCFTSPLYGRADGGFRDNIQMVRRGDYPFITEANDVRAHTSYRTFNTAKRQEIIDI